ncbi:phage portal protein [Clostridium butyricum]|uniref:Phage portal protein, HK97 family n=1 Tax=Clostridium butyricum E4 str. BoNT E BL5262 TaxID=632245 RepID=C4IGS3_CLOBU|nr:phage portal protein [Clostridium butyricum]EDT74763.1 phage portal protein, HK97 family [Clostridium butyricum 5521]EEP54999.1 phage portal protein, HK97 family [Clostridium butyricum E4 str. BoNT E BL5262]NFL30491.1 phage portal protein [Clostridium butyricum]NFS19446.1 phage portal protein [Clostridium butyricum]
MIFNKLAEKRNSTSEEYDWTEWVRGEKAEYMSEKDSTYNRCVSILGDTVAKLPIVVKQSTEKGELECDNFYLNELLKLRPNPNMNMFECIKAFVMLFKHKGIAGIYINRDIRGQIRGLYPVRIDNITLDNLGLIKSTKINKVLIDFTCIDVSGSCFDDEIIILRDNSIDGIYSKSTRSYMKDSIDTNIKAQKYQNDLFSNGLTNKAVVQYTSDIKDEKEMKKIQAKFDRIYTSSKRIFTVPAGYSVNPLNLNLADSQFAELKIIGKKEISSAIGIPFGLIEKGSLTEEENIAFLSNAISPIIIALEQELNWKLLLDDDRKRGYKIRFNVNAMLRTSPEKQSLILDRYVKDGIYTINDCKRILGVPLVEGGDTVTLPSGQVTLENLINGEAGWQNKKPAKGGDDNE